MSRSKDSLVDGLLGKHNLQAAALRESVERMICLLLSLLLRMTMLLRTSRHCSLGHQLGQPFCPAQERQHGAAEGFAKNVPNIISVARVSDLYQIFLIKWLSLYLISDFTFTSCLMCSFCLYRALLRKSRPIE